MASKDTTESLPTNLGEPEINPEEQPDLRVRAALKTALFSIIPASDSLAVWAGAFSKSELVPSQVPEESPLSNDVEGSAVAERRSGHFGTNEVHRVNGSVFQNVGVRHSAEDLERARGVILSAINSADIVLLEHLADPFREKDCLWAGDYFSELAAYAIRSGKEAFFIDPIKEKAIAAAIIVPAMITTPVILGANAFLYKDSVDPERKRGWTRRAVLACCCEAFVGFTASAVLMRAEGDGYSWYDFSLATDGRTLAMLRNTLRVIEDNPGKRFMVLSGDYHARGIEYYLANPEIFAAKLAVYENTFGLLEGEDGSIGKVRTDCS